MSLISLKKCLIANRGEIALRILRACREMGLQAVAVYSEADARAPHVQQADEAALIGPAPPTESYLRADKLMDAALRHGCDCVHPGYGFLAESAAFARAVLDAGLVWVGPSPDAIDRMGVKTEARTLMQAAGVPVVPGFQAHDADESAFHEAAERIGYPVMVKAAGGGGGKGIRVVHEAAQLSDALAGARHEARNAFGDERIFLERYIERGHHIEIQVIADAHGNTLHLFERECSAQRRHQKIIEETPSPLVTPDMRARMGQAAVDAARAVAYVNAGTVEFIATPQGDFYFLEMNTRLQVEHPVTELVTGVDLVQLQLRVAAGEALPMTQDDLRQTGHAIECRLYAEDPDNDFLPAIGPVHRFVPPTGPGLRVDSGVQSGDAITLHYDPMIAKIIAHAPTREAAIQRMVRALNETVLLGTRTNRAFLLRLLQHPAFHAGRVDTRFVDEQRAELTPPAAPPDDLAFIAAALSERATLNDSAAESLSSEADAHSPWSRADGFRLGQGRP